MRWWNGGVERHALKCVIPMLAAFAFASLAHAQTMRLPAVRTPVELLAKDMKGAIEDGLRLRLHEAANGRAWLAERRGPIHVSVKFDEKGQVLVDLGPGLGDLSNTPDMEDLENWLLNEVEVALDDKVIHHGIVFLFDGKDMYFYHPEDRRRATGDAAAPSDLSTVVVSAGHGYYRLFGQNGSDYAWVLQRSEQHGVQEDVVTMEYATLLQEALRQRAGIPSPKLTRFDSDLTHAGTGKPWSHVAARYYLAWQYPDAPGIWHSLPGVESSDRERREDIRSRPLFANHIGAGALIHLHTNAGPPTARGTRVFYDRGSPESKRLGDALLCGMKEVVRALPKYSDFRMDDESRNDGSYGENALASMPSALVELAFHSNEEDAAALLDDDFRNAAVNGLAKGFKLYKENRECEPFTMTGVDEASGYVGRNGTVKVRFRGFPTSPVTLRFEEIDCDASTAECMSQQGTGTFDVSPATYYGLRCPSLPGQRRFRLTLVDGDGVASNTVEGVLNCKDA